MDTKETKHHEELSSVLGLLPHDDGANKMFGQVAVEELAPWMRLLFENVAHVGECEVAQYKELLDPCGLGFFNFSTLLFLAAEKMRQIERSQDKDNESTQLPVKRVHRNDNYSLRPRRSLRKPERIIYYEKSL